MSDSDAELLDFALGDEPRSDRESRADVLLNGKVKYDLSVSDASSGGDMLSLEMCMSLVASEVFNSCSCLLSIRT